MNIFKEFYLVSAFLYETKKFTELWNTQDSCRKGLEINWRLEEEIRTIRQMKIVWEYEFVYVSFNFLSQ